MSFIQDITSKATSMVSGAFGSITSKVDPRQIQSKLKGAGYVKNRSNESMFHAMHEYPAQELRETDDYVVFYINEYVYTAGAKGDVQGNKNNQGATGNLGKVLNAVSTEKVGASKSSTGTSLFDVLGLTDDKGNATLVFAPPRKRSSAVIALYMPHSFQSNYGMQYGEVNADGILGTMLDSYSKSGNIKDAANTGFEAFKSEAGKSLGGVVANIVDAGRGSGSASWKNQLTKTVRNPRKETSFVGVNFRQFQFSFLLTPSSQEEAEKIKTIIGLFKLHMHPNVTSGNTGNLNMEFPNDFDIKFMHGTDENKHINKILTCVLENMSVSYTPNNMWSTHTDGAPTATVLTLQFREVEPLNRGHIKDNY